MIREYSSNQGGGLDWTKGLTIPNLHFLSFVTNDSFKHGLYKEFKIITGIFEPSRMYLLIRVEGDQELVEMYIRLYKALCHEFAEQDPAVCDGSHDHQSAFFLLKALYNGEALYEQGMIGNDWVAEMIQKAKEVDLSIIMESE